MLRRGAIVAVVVLLLAGTPAYPHIAPAPVIIAPTVALAAETDRRDPRLPRLPASGETTPAPRVLLGAATTSRVVALTFDLDMNAGMAAAARPRPVGIYNRCLCY